MLASVHSPSTFGKFTFSHTSSGRYGNPLAMTFCVRIVASSAYTALRSGTGVVSNPNVPLDAPENANAGIPASFTA